MQGVKGDCRTGGMAGAGSLQCTTGVRAGAFSGALCDA